MLKPSLAVAVAVLTLAVPVEAIAQQTGSRIEGSVPLIELRLARVEPSPGFHAMESASTGSQFYLSEDRILSDNEIESVRASESADGLILHVRLTEAGADRLRRATSEHLGEHLAVLVDSHLMTAPAIVSALALSDRRVTIGLTLSKNEAVDVASAMAARWPEPN